MRRLLANGAVAAWCRASGWGVLEQHLAIAVREGPGTRTQVDVSRFAKEIWRYFTRAAGRRRQIPLSDSTPRAAVSSPTPPPSLPHRAVPRSAARAPRPPARDNAACPGGGRGSLPGAPAGGGRRQGPAQPPDAGAAPCPAPPRDPRRGGGHVGATGFGATSSRVPPSRGTGEPSSRSAGAGPAGGTASPPRRRWEPALTDNARPGLPLQVKLKDGRLLTGTFHCLDSQSNLILTNGVRRDGPAPPAGGLTSTLPFPSFRSPRRRSRSTRPTARSSSRGRSTCSSSRGTGG